MKGGRRHNCATRLYWRMTMQVDSGKKRVDAGKPTRSWESAAEDERARRDQAAITGCFRVTRITVEWIVVSPAPGEVPDCIGRRRGIKLW